MKGTLTVDGVRCRLKQRAEKYWILEAESGMVTYLGLPVLRWYREIGPITQIGNIVCFKATTESDQEVIVTLSPDGEYQEAIYYGKYGNTEGRVTGTSPKKVKPHITHRKLINNP